MCLVRGPENGLFFGWKGVVVRYGGDVGRDGQSKRGEKLRKVTGGQDWE